MGRSVKLKSFQNTICKTTPVEISISYTWKRSMKRDMLLLEDNSFPRDCRKSNEKHKARYDLLIFMLLVHGIL